MERNFKVLLLTKYPRLGASTRLRSLQYLPLLKKGHFSFTIQCLFDDQYLGELYLSGARSKAGTLKFYIKRFLALLKFYKYDLIWIEYEIFPYLPAFAERFLKFAKKPYIVDYDDSIFHNYDLSPNSLIRRYLGKKISVVMRLADHVIAGNTYLAEYAKCAGAKRVTIVPTVVDHTRYPCKSISLDRQPIIGWIGSPSTQKYVIEIYPALLAACTAFNAKLLLVGATSNITSYLKGINVEVIPWSENTEAQLINKMDVGIMPLHDGPWEQGKCGYKLIQYMACAVAVIATPIGVNREIVMDNDAGLLAVTLESWQEALFKLLGSSALRHEYGKQGRQAVVNKYSLQSKAPAMIQILNESLVHNNIS